MIKKIKSNEQIIFSKEYNIYSFLLNFLTINYYQTKIIYLLINILFIFLLYPFDIQIYIE